MAIVQRSTPVHGPVAQSTSPGLDPEVGSSGVRQASTRGVTDDAAPLRRGAAVRLVAGAPNPGLQLTAPTGRRVGVARTPGGPGYQFFAAVFGSGRPEALATAMRLGDLVDHSGRLEDAKRAYRFFYRQLDGFGLEAKVAAAEAAVLWVAGGAGSLEDVVRTYAFFYQQFDGTDDSVKIAAAWLASFGVGQGIAPAEIRAAYWSAYLSLPGSDNATKLEAAKTAVGADEP